MQPQPESNTKVHQTLTKCQITKNYKQVTVKQLQ